MVAGEARNVMPNSIHGKVLSLRFHVTSGAYAQKNTESDVISVEEFLLVWVLLNSMLSEVELRGEKGGNVQENLIAAKAS